MPYTHQNSVIILPSSPATYRHRLALRADGFEWDGKQWEHQYDDNTYFKWVKIMRREPDAGQWPVRRIQRLGFP